MQTTPDHCEFRGGLLKKEIRQLLPGLLLALLMAAGCRFLETANSLEEFISLLFPLNLLLLSLASFGREFSSGTFALLLAQPIERAQIWRVKTIPLALATALIWAVWSVGTPLGHSLRWHFGAGTTSAFQVNLYLTTAWLAFLMYSGGLWASLLFRQISTALWMALLAPFGLVSLIEVMCWNDSAELVGRIIAVAGLAYAVLGLFLARGLLLRTQDLHGKSASIPVVEAVCDRLIRKTLYSDGHRPPLQSDRTSRALRPRLALLRKEIHLQKPQLFLAAALMGLHLAAIVARTHCVFPVNSALKDVLEHFWVAWLLLPFLVGCTAVAEERKLGTQGGQLTLSLRRRGTFIWKVAAVAILSVLFGVCLPLLLDGNFQAQTNQAWRETLFTAHNWCSAALDMPMGVWGHFLVGILQACLPFLPYLLLAGACLVIAGIAFFISSVCENVLQAVGAALFALVIGVVLVGLAGDLRRIAGNYLWEGPLIYCITFPILAVTLAALAYRNHQKIAVNGKLWRDNVLVITIALLFSAGLTTLVYHRAWEFLSPAEPAASAAHRITAPARIARTYHNRLIVTFADGRVWVNRYRVFGNPLFGWGIEKDPLSCGGSFLPGSDWKSVGAMDGSLVGLRADGSLWISEHPDLPSRAVPRGFTRMLAHCSRGPWKELGHDSGLLLKVDGSLWRWGGSSEDWRRWQSGLMNISLSRVDGSSDWVSLRALGNTGLLKANGETWVFCSELDDYPKIKIDGGYLRRFPGFSGKTFRDSARFSAWDGNESHGYNHFSAGIADDGTFRQNIRREYQPTKAPRATKSGLQSYRWVESGCDVQIGSDNRWVNCVSLLLNTAVTLRDDGTLWEWSFHQSPHQNPKGFTQTRIGQRSDWVGLASFGWSGASFITLAADGSLWLWEKGYYGFHWLAPSRHPQYLGNVFDRNR